MRERQWGKYPSQSLERAEARPQLQLCADSSLCWRHSLKRLDRFGFTDSRNRFGALIGTMNPP